MTAYPGIVAPTAHRRANSGGFNESITWHLAHSYWWRVESHHFLSLSPVKPAFFFEGGTIYSLIFNSSLTEARKLFLDELKNLLTNFHDKIYIDTVELWGILNAQYVFKCICV